jgi:hypothetical protein
MMSFEPPALAAPRVEHEPAYVEGFPALVAVELCPMDPGDLFRVPDLRVPAVAGGVGVALRDRASGKEVLRRPPSPALEGATIALSGGLPHRLLVDLLDGPLGHLPRGEYLAEVGYPALGATAWSAPFPLSVRPASPEERALLAAWKPEQRRGPRWSTWLLTPPPRPLDASADDPPAAWRPLRYHDALRMLLFDRRAFAQIGEQDLAALDGLLAPEREALRVELAYASGGRDAARSKAAVGARATPGLSWWVEAACAGRGPIAALREGLRAVLRW